jgi:hypothetical protein
MNGEICGLRDATPTAGNQESAVSTIAPMSAMEGCWMEPQSEDFQYASDQPVEFTQEAIVNAIIGHFDDALRDTGHLWFSQLIKAIYGVRSSALSGWAQPINQAQYDSLVSRARAAQALTTRHFGPPMAARLSTMFDGICFLIAFWKKRKPDAKVEIAGSLAQANAIAKATELFLEFSRLWVFVDEINGEVIAARQATFAGMLDVSGVTANDEGAT